MYDVSCDEKPLQISVVIPVYNVAAYLASCVQSLLAQTLPPAAILLVDDGSTDGSGQLCDQLQLQHPESIRVLHQPNQGVSRARNTGMQAVKTEYLTFVDPDDWLEPDMLRQMAAALAGTGAQAAFCGFAERFCDAQKEDILHQPAAQGVVTGAEALYQCLNGIGKGYFSAVWGKMFRTDALYGPEQTLLLMQEGCAISEDELWLTQLLPKLETVVLLPRPFYNWRQRTGSALHTAGAFSAKWYSSLAAKKQINELLKADSRFAGLVDAKLYADLSHLFWQAYCSGAQQDYHYFRRELAPYKKAFYRSKEFSRARKLKTAVMDIMIFLHLPKGWMETLGNFTALELKRKLRRKQRGTQEE